MARAVLEHKPADGPVPDVLDSAEAGRRVIRGGALRVAGFVAGVGASVVGAALVTRHLGPADYGRYQTVVALVTIVQTVTDLGMATLALREYAQRTGADRDRFMRVLLGMRLALTGLGVVVAVLLAIALGYEGQMLAGTALMGAGVVIGIMAATLATPLAAEIRMSVVTGLDVSRQVLTTVGFVVLVVLGASVAPFLAVMIPVNTLLLLATLWFVRGQVPLRPSFDRREWLALVRPTITFALATAVGSLYTYTALILTSQVASEHETGVFAASFRVFAIVATVPAILVTTAFPVLSRAARDDRERLRYATERLFEGNAVFGGAALIGCLLGAQPIITVVAGNEFQGAVGVLRIQGLALAVTFVVGVWGFALLAMHRHKAMITVNALALVVTAATVLTLASAHGAKGAAYGTLLGEATLALGYLVALVSDDRRMRPRLVRVARAVPAVALGLAAGLLPLPAVLTTAIGLLVYALGLLAFGALPDEVLDHLPRPKRRRATAPRGG